MQFLWTRVVTVGVAASIFFFVSIESDGDTVTTATDEAVDASFAPDEQNNEAVVYKRISPSVVTIRYTCLVDSTLQRFSLDAEEKEECGYGSGFVWDSSGLIVTNYHVIKKRQPHHDHGPRSPKEVTKPRLSAPHLKKISRS